MPLEALLVKVRIKMSVDGRKEHSLLCRAVSGMLCRGRSASSIMSLLLLMSHEKNG